MAELWEDLRDQIGEGRALLVVGAGVSMGATRGAPAASWPGLLKSGVERCEEVAAELPEGWGEWQLKAIASRRIYQMVRAADEVTYYLTAAGEGEYRRWLRETVGALKAQEPATLEALRDLSKACKLPIATTNYDPLLEAVTRRPPVTWLQPEEALRVVRGEEEAILHLHGFWKEPKSVVLGVRSYDDLLRSVPAQTVQEVLALTRSFVFVGCGGTFQDPNFTALLAWLREHFGGVEHRHFRLCLDDEEAGLRTEHAKDRIFPVPFGEDYGELPGFLRSLLPKQPAQPARTPASANPAITAYRAWAKDHYGRLNLVGLGAGEIRLRLDEVYVPLRIAGWEREEEGPHTEHHPGWATGGDLELHDVFHAGSPDQPHVLLLGEPGSGKTTALRKLLHQCLTQGPESLDLPAGILPVFLRLRQLKDTHLADPLSAFLQRELDQTVNEAEAERAVGEEGAPATSLPPAPDSTGLGRELWQSGNLLLLMDGLDEVADDALRGRICRYLERQLAGAASRGIRTVVSCRRASYGEVTPKRLRKRAKSAAPPKVELGALFLHLEVKPLSPQQCRALVEKWFEAAERALTHLTPEEARAIAGELTDTLESPEVATQRWQVLVSTPLLLTLLCIVRLRGGEMPRSRAAFYGECLKVLLGSWSRHERGQKPPLDSTTALLAVRALAHHLHAALRRDDLRKTEAVRLLRRVLTGAGKSVDPFVVLHWLRREAAVLEELTPNRYGFRHLGLQEYLTALEISTRGKEAARELASYFGDPWWKEVTLLLVGLPGHRLFAPLMGRVLASKALFEHRELVRECLEEASEVDLGPFLALLELGAAVKRQAAVLRLLLGRREEGLLEKAAELAALGEGEVKALAERLLAEAKAPEREDGPSMDLFLLGRPEAAAEVKELTDRLRRRGVQVYEPTEPEEWETELEEILPSARGLGLVVSPGEAAPWELPEIRDCLELFLEEKRPVLPVLLPGVHRRPTWPDDLPTLEWVDLRKDRAEGFLVLERLLAGAVVEEAVAGPPKVSPDMAFTEPVTDIRFLWVPGGRFRMGGTKAYDGKPEHWVRVTPLWLGETPVTNRQYAVFLKATSRDEPKYWRERRFSSPQQPVVGVSWADAQAFCQWLANKLGRAVALPSEAQWEFAARGTDRRDYPWGNDPPAATRACFRPHWKENNPAPVGSFPAGKGPFGTLDQAGNVWEWCLDVWDEAAYTKREGQEIVDPVVTEGNADLRALRGGGWVNSAVDLRAAFRNRNRARHRDSGIGFRVAIVAPSRRPTNGLFFWQSGWKLRNQ